MVSKPLELEVFAGDIQTWANSVILKGEKSCLLIDSQFFASDAKKLVEKIKATGLPLTDILVTHSHPDHVWGSVEVLKADISQVTLCCGELGPFWGRLQL